MILIDKYSINNIWPSPQANPSENLNAITRLVILLSIVGGILTKNIKLIGIGFVTIICIIGVHLYMKYTANKMHTKESFTQPHKKEKNKQSYNPRS